MELIKYNNASDFLNENLGFLETQEAINNLLIGISFSNRHLETDNTIYLSIKNENGIQFNCIKTHGRNLLVYGDKNYYNQFIPILIDFLIQKKIDIPGVIGPKSLAIKITKYWKQKTNNDSKVKFNQLIYCINKVKYLPKTNGRLILATFKDLDLISKWFHLFIIEALNEEDKESAHKIAIKKIKNREVFIWYDKLSVATASIARPTNNGITINYVYTPIEYRNNGYATKLVAQLSQQMLEKGFNFCSLFTDLKNQTSNKIYRKIGYKQIAEFRQIDFLRKTNI